MNRSALLLVIASAGSIAAFACGGSSPSAPATGVEPDAGIDASLDGNGGVVPPPQYPDAAPDSHAGDAGEESPDTGNGCAAHVADDPNNCGTCGHSCQGGTCSAGQCQPVVLVTGEGGFDLALAGSSLYFTGYQNQTLLIKQMKTDGTGLAPFAGAGTSPVALTADSTNVYWTKDDPTNAAWFWADRVTPVASSPSPIAGRSLEIRVDSGYVYFLGGGAVYRQQLAAGTTPQFLGGTSVGRFAVDDTSIYAMQGGMIVKFPKDGSCSGSQCGKTIISTPNCVNVTVDATRVYCLNGGLDVQVSVANKDGSGGSFIGPKLTLGSPQTILADNDSIYMDEGGSSGWVSKMNLDGSNQHLIASNLSNSGRMVQDNATIYWINYGEGNGLNATPPSIMKIAK